MKLAVGCWTGCMLVLLGVSSLQAQEIDRGRGLYETNCVGCHDTSVHRREVRVARDVAALREQVERWGRNTGARLRPDEVDAVTVYLNGLYYNHPCPSALCPPTRAGLDRGGR